MGAAGSSAAPGPSAPASLGPEGGVDRARLHDVPWMATLVQLGQRLFPVDGERLEEWVRGASDNELYCARALFRAWRAYSSLAHGEEARDFASGVYLMLAQQPEELVQLYTLLHCCWALGAEVVLPDGVPGIDWARVVYATYCDEKGRAPPVDDADAAARARMGPLCAGIIESYLRKTWDLTTNPEFLDAEVAAFGEDPEARVWTLRAADASIEVRVTNYGAAIVGCRVADRTGHMREVVHSPQSVEGLRADESRWYGATIGRYANRIAGATFECRGQRFSVDPNEGNTHLHGGSGGFGRRMWTPAPEPEHSSGSTVAFTLVSQAGDMGYPGLLAVRVEYSVRPGAHLAMRYNAQLFGDAVECPVNLTNHTYWRLGDGAVAASHSLWLDCDRVVHCDSSTLLPSGRVDDVRSTTFDHFSAPRSLAREQHLDSCFCVREWAHHRPKLVATLRCAASGLAMDVVTTEPGVQVYTGCADGVCLECGAWPDSPNQPSFPFVLLHSDGPQYAQLTIHSFRVE